MKILFIRGFSLSNDPVYDEYKQIDLFFRNSKYELEYFGYKTDEQLDMVYKRLEITIKHGNYSILMGHSMGGSLLTKFCRANDIGSTKIILLMPFISTYSVWENLLKLEFAKGLIIPKSFTLPLQCADGIHIQGLFNLLSAITPDILSFVEIQQFFYSKYVLLNNVEILELFDNRNIHLIYSPTDILVSFEPTVLSLIKNKYAVEGGHLSFYSNKYNNTFFDKLSLVLAI
jgi:hypothetical protein